MRNKLLTHVIAIVGILFFAANLFGQASRDTDYKADQNLRSSARVNPSTLAMEFSLPLMSYPGRAGNSVPVSLNYSSKVWTMKHFEYLNPTITTDIVGGQGSYENPYQIYTVTSFTAEYAERTLAGWTSAGLQPFELKWDDRDHREVGAGYYFRNWVQRVRIIFPDGSSHEFRKDDRLYRCAGYANYGGNDDCEDLGVYALNGKYLSVDGTGMRYEYDGSNSTVFMPDGSRYLITINGHTYIDRFGNRSIFDNATRTLMDTMGREIASPLPVSPAAGTQQLSFPGIDESDVEYNVKYSVLKPEGCETGFEFYCDDAALENPTDDLHYVGNDSCPSQLVYPFYPLSPHLFEVYPPTWTDRSEGGGQQIPVYYRDFIAQRMCGADTLFNPVVPVEIELPDGTKYNFRYNIYGEMTKIVYPTGAYERFIYDAIPGGGDFPFSQVNRGVVERWLSEDGASETQQWQYSKSYFNVVTTINPDGTKSERSLFPISAWHSGFQNPLTGMPHDEKIYSKPSTPGVESTRTLLRRELTEWTVAPPRPGGTAEVGVRDARPVRRISIVFEPGESDALASMTETEYDSNNDPEYFAHMNPVRVKTYGYVAISASAAATDTLETAVSWFSPSDVVKITETDYLYDSNYKIRNLTSLPTESRIKDPAANVRAKTQIVYDESGYDLSSSGTMPTEAAGSWIDPVTELGGTVGAKRALPTTVKNYHDITNGYYIETHSFYDQFGNPRKSRDGRGNDTVTVYDDDYAFAYPTKVITPVPDPYGTHGSNTAFEVVTTYDHMTGLSLTVTDANGKTTTTEYNDPLLRPTKVTAPNGHETVMEYGAGTIMTTRWVKVTSDIDETNSKYAVKWFDGLGRTWLTQSEDSNGDVFSITCYDDFGRVAKTSNPFRGYTNQTCSTTTGMEWTTPDYDDFGRVVSVTTPDNAVVTTAYSLATSGSQIGSVTTVTDQAGKLRRSITNALGQLVRVDEPDNSSSVGSLGAIDNPNQPTYYAYDTFSNLTKVKQGGTFSNPEQERTFTYDSLSRLLTATNPESGTISYGYDSNGNLTTKTDARSITTTYSYDALNRVTQRNYSDSTPNVSYFYDNLTNAKGQLTKISSSVSTTEYTSFDILGRVTGHKQTTDGQDYITSYVYNLSGALIEQTYPSGRVVKNVLDGNGYLSIVQSKKNSSAGYWNYAQNFTYNAAGAVTSMQLGNGKWESTTFNSRFQPTQIGLGSTQNTTNLLKLDYSYGTNDNNGNVLSQIITVPTVGIYLGFTATQNYTYDSLNRLKSAEEIISSLTSWKQTFTFDRYGNRNFDEANTTTLPKSCLDGVNPIVCTSDRKIFNPSIDSATNKLNTSQDYSYDDAGNMTQDAEERTFIYDAENRQVEVIDDKEETIGQYWYDGDGKRVKKYVPNTGEVTVFVYNATGQLVVEYSTIVESVNDAKVAYMTNDYLGSPRVNTGRDGNVTARHDYHPFGEKIYSPNRITGLDYDADTIRKQFTGYERDIETDLDFAQARMYSSRHGRFSVVDPILGSVYPVMPQTWNRFVYCLNNPYKYVDPSGLIWTYQDNGNIRTFRWFEKEEDIEVGWTPYTGSNYFIGDGEAIFLGAKGKSKKVSVEEAGLGQLDEFLRGPDSPLGEREKARLTRAFVERVRSFHWEDDFIAALAGTSLGAIADRGLKALAALFTSKAALVETAELAGMLRQAMAGKGNFGIGSATVDQANAMGRAWVGEGYKVAKDGVTLISNDGLRQFRPPSFKPNQGKVQANFEWRPDNLKQWQGNGHLDIK